MSHVTDTFLLTSVLFDPSEYSKENTQVMDKVQAWLKEDCNQQFKRLDDNHKAYGGRKVLQASVWCGAFNYLSLEEFIVFLKTLDFGATAQLLYQDEYDDGFTLVELWSEKEREKTNA